MGPPSGLHGVTSEQIASAGAKGRIRFPRDGHSSNAWVMTAAKVIEDLLHLPREEQSRVLEFAFELARKRQLSGNELSALAQRMVDSDDPAEVGKLKSETTRGFYGD